MKSRVVGLFALLCLPLPAASGPAPSPEAIPQCEGRIVGGPAARGAKAVVDTVVLVGPHGSGAPAVGTFENPFGGPAWNGWTSVDYTTDNDPLWHVDTFHAVSGTYSAWCGDATLPSCGQAWDETGGYPNNSWELLEWRGTVADNSLPCTVTVAALANLDTEPGYDYCAITCEKSGGATVDLWSGDGLATAAAIGGATAYSPADYLGSAADEVRVLFRFASDGGFGGDDCIFPNDGAIQLDDVVITLDNGTGYSHDFEDGTLGAFRVYVQSGVGDFARIWSGLDDLDPCLGNGTPQVAFIDDGVVVPGTGGSTCIDWCYGPGGYVVNTTGVLYDDLLRGSYGAYLDNGILSPPLELPGADHDGLRLAFDVYAHENLSGDTPGVFYTWAVRSTAGGTDGDLARARWRSFGGLGFGGPGYRRNTVDVAELVVPGATRVQVRLSAVQNGWTGPVGPNASPAPYFDNVRVESFPAAGPALSVAPGNLAADAFPGSGTVDLADLGANSVPFKASAAVDPPSTPYDALQINCAPVGAGATLNGPPQLHYILDRNPLFDPWRTAGMPDTGTVACIDDGSNRWTYSLPDTGFLFPGDRLHYCFTAAQTVGGLTETVILPPDTTGFSSFADDPVFNGGYAPAFSVRALPTVREDATLPGTFAAARTLFWHDSGTDGDWAVWNRALGDLARLGLDPPDVFHTQAAASRLRNGLGARATVAQLAGYDVMIYTAGEMSAGTLDAGAQSGRPNSPDALLVDAWLRLGDRGLLAFGNDLASDLAAGIPDQAALLSAWFDCTVDARDVRPLIDGQASVRVLSEPSNPVLLQTASWLAYGGGCTSETQFENRTTLVRDRFDALIAGSTATRLASWTAPGGSPGAYPYAAALACATPEFSARTILVPIDFRLVHTDADEGAKTTAPPAARTRLLADALAWFGVDLDGGGSYAGVPDAAVFRAALRPNPFNPTTTIAYTVPRPGHLTVRVYDVRGRLVRTLVDAPAQQDGAVDWDGTRDDGTAAASGVYFYEVGLGGEVQVGKMALVK